MSSGEPMEERALLAAFARVMAGATEKPPDSDPEHEARVRAYTETLGLLPYELDPVAPRAETRARILAEIGVREPRREVDEVTLAGPARSRVAAADPWPELAAGGPVEPPPASAEPASRREVFETPALAPPPSSSRWLLPLAAMLALSLLGLGFLAGQLSDRNATIARLDGQLQSLPIENLGALESDLDTMKRRFNMVTAVARRAYPLEVVQSPDPSAQLDGVVYVCGHHQRWYLNVQGLVPPPSGQEYHLWFLTDRGPINGGVVEVGPDATTEKDAQSMPEGTHAFAITLEKAGPHREPEGMMVLLGEESVSL